MLQICAARVLGAVEPGDELALARLEPAEDSCDVAPGIALRGRAADRRGDRRARASRWAKQASSVTPSAVATE